MRASPWWIAFFACALPGVASGATFHWVGLCGASNDWLCAANWFNENFDPMNPVYLPRPVDTAHVDDGGTVEVTAAVTASSLTLGNSLVLGGHLLVEDGAILQLGFALTVAKADSATAVMTGGQIATGSVTVGAGAIGSFVQSGGTIDASSLNLGTDAAGTGDYALSAGQINAHLYVGGSGIGRFIQTGGAIGSASAPKVIRLGTAVGGEGTYTLNSGSVFANDSYIGLASRGTIIQNGGTFGGKSLGLYVANNSGSTGTYELDGGTLSYAAPEFIGYRGTGLLTQNGGLNEPYSVDVGYYGHGTYRQTGGTANVGLTSNGSLYVAVQPGSVGTVELSDSAVMNVQQQMGVGVSGTGDVWQRTGTQLHAGVGFYFGSNTGSVGSYLQEGGLTTMDHDLTLGIGGSGAYELRGGDLSVGGNLSMATNPSGTGDFNHSGGNNTVADDLRLRGGGHASYELSATGSLVANNEYLSAASGGSAEFVQTGGTNLVASRLCLACDGSGSSGSYRLVDGTLHTRILQVSLPPSGGPASLTLGGSSAQLIVDSLMVLGPGGGLQATTGAVLHMTGSTFDNQSTNETALNGLGTLEMIFEGGSGDIDPFEVAGIDKGSTADGLVDNFALGTLTLGGADIGRVRLVDDRVNQPGSGARDVLYVHTLNVGPGSYLDLNGRTLYYVIAAIDAAATIVLGGGALIQIPPPAGVTEQPETLGSGLRCSPNPTRSGAEFQFALSEPAYPVLRIFDASGRKIRTLFVEASGPGRKFVIWDTKDDAGNPVAPGVHFAQLTVGRRRETLRFVIVR